MHPREAPGFGDPWAEKPDDRPNGGALLGRATTRQLLRELLARVEYRDETEAFMLAEAARALLEALPDWLLSYRPIDGFDVEVVG